MAAASGPAGTTVAKYAQTPMEGGAKVVSITGMPAYQTKSIEVRSTFFQCDLPHFLLQELRVEDYLRVKVRLYGAEFVQHLIVTQNGGAVGGGMAQGGGIQLGGSPFNKPGMFSELLFHLM